MKDKIIKTATIGLAGLFTVVIWSLVFGAFVMLLWNWLMPDLFSLSKINVFEGIGLCLLTGILIGDGASGS